MVRSFSAAALCATGPFSAPLRGGDGCSSRWTASTGAAGAAENSPASLCDAAVDAFFFLPTSLSPRVDRKPPIAAVAQQYEGIRQEPDAISLEQRELGSRRIHELRPDATTRQLGQLEGQVRRRVA